MKDPAIFLISFCLLFFCLTTKAQTELIPQPSGFYPVGFQSFTIRDSLRRDFLVPKEYRPISVRIWYPANERSEKTRSYLEDKLAAKMLQESYQHQDSAALSKLRFFRTYSLKNAVLVKENKFPLILFSHGLGVSKDNYTLLAEELASRGNMIVTIDHPYGGFTLTDKGRFLSSRQDSLLYKSKGDEILLERMNSWAEDIGFVMKQMLSENNLLGKNFRRSIDSSKIVTMGHSLGGNVALKYPSIDKRIIAAINLDGGTFTNLRNPPRVPTLTIRSQPVYSEDELKEKGRTLAQWEAMGHEIDHAFEMALKGAKESYEIKIKGVGHMSFSDAPFVLPDMITRFGGQIMDFNKASKIISDFITAFLDASFIGEKPSFEDILDQCPNCHLNSYLD